MSDAPSASLDKETARAERGAAEDAFRQTSTTELLSLGTRGERDRLLATSLLALAFGIVGLQPTEIAVSGAKLPLTVAWALPAALLATLAYFLVSFGIGGWLDRNRWRALVGPESHAFLRTNVALHAQRDRLLRDVLADTAERGEALSRLLALQAERQEIRTARDKLLSNTEPTAETISGYIDPQTPDTSTLDARIEELQENLKLSLKQIQTKIRQAEEFPKIASPAAWIDAERYWRVQNMWYLGVPILIGLFSCVVVAIRLVKVFPANSL